MSLKDKLELAWKYLALLVITILGINAINAYNQNGNQNYGDFLSIYDGNFDKEDVQVKKEIIDGDTLMKIKVNGIDIDLDDFELKNGKIDDLNVMVLDIDDFIGDSTTNKKILKKMKKKIIIKEN